MKMKIIVSAVILFIAAAILAIAIPVSRQYDSIQTNKDFENIALRHERGEDVTAVSEGVSLLLTAANLRRVINLLTVSERMPVSFPKKRPGECAVSIFLGDDTALYIVAGEPVGSKDFALLYFEFKGKNRCFSFKGYRLVENVQNAVSPEGFHGANTVIS